MENIADISVEDDSAATPFLGYEPLGDQISRTPHTSMGQYAEMNRDDTRTSTADDAVSAPDAARAEEAARAARLEVTTKEITQALLTQAQRIPPRGVVQHHQKEISRDGTETDMMVGF